MKINAKAFTVTLTIIAGLLILILSVWTRVSTQFGHEFMDVFNSIHPHPFRATLGSLSMAEEVYGIGYDLFYAVIDAILFALGFSLLYNRLAAKKEVDD